MPIYEYQCSKCGKRFEYMQKMADPPKKKCEACGGKLDRLISPAGFHLKGTGWYKTDYASKPAEKKDDKPAEKKPEPKAGPKEKKD
jgi:putative FmdB family regulatory protein